MCRTLDCFLSVAFRTVCWCHVEFGCSSAGGVERESGVCVGLYEMFLYVAEEESKGVSAIH